MQHLRFGVWNLDSSQPAKARRAQRAVLAEEGVVWLLTEVHDVAVDGLCVVPSGPVAGMPNLSWSAVVGGGPGLEAVSSTHPTLALARMPLAGEGDVLLASSVLPWRGAGRYWPAADPGTYRERFTAALDHHRRIIESAAADGLRVVWGGDFNQELEGPLHVGTSEGRAALLKAFDALGLRPLTTSAGGHPSGTPAIDHLAVPRGWQCEPVVAALPTLDGKPLSDHPSYQAGCRVGAQ